MSCSSKEGRILQLMHNRQTWQISEPTIWGLLISSLLDVNSSSRSSSVIIFPIQSLAPQCGMLFRLGSGRFYWCDTRWKSSSPLINMLLTFLAHLLQILNAKLTFLLCAVCCILVTSEYCCLFLSLAIVEFLKTVTIVEFIKNSWLSEKRILIICNQCYVISTFFINFNTSSAACPQSHQSPYWLCLSNGGAGDGRTIQIDFKSICIFVLFSLL